jgi:hypothetical protein
MNLEANSLGNGLHDTVMPNNQRQIIISILAHVVDCSFYRSLVVLLEQRDKTKLYSYRNGFIQSALTERLTSTPKARLNSDL